MLVATFICRYGNQDYRMVRDLTDYERSLMFHALAHHLEAEFKPAEAATTAPPTE